MCLTILAEVELGLWHCDSHGEVLFIVPGTPSKQGQPAPGGIFVTEAAA